MQRYSATLLLVLGVLTAASAQLMVPPDIEAYNRHSESGEYELYVKPSRPSSASSTYYAVASDGKMVAKAGLPRDPRSSFYALTSKGTVVWARTLPYTLNNSFVTDKGEVCGYAEGFSMDRSHPGEINLVVLGPSGHARSITRIQKAWTQLCDSPPLPYVLGMHVSQNADRMIVNLAFDHRHRCYSISTGREATWACEKAFNLEAETLRPVNFDFVRGTPLLLVQLHVYSKRGETVASRFEVFGPDGRKIWSRQFDDKYNEFERDPDLGVYTDRGYRAIDTTAFRSFVLRGIRVNRTERYVVANDSRGGWTVRNAATGF
jgi:hypothetical protein